MTPEDIQAQHIAAMENPKPTRPPSVALFGPNTATARYPFVGQVHLDLVAPRTTGPNDEWAIPAQHITVLGTEAAEALRDFLTAAIDHAKSTAITKA